LARVTSEQIDQQPGLTVEGQVMGTPDFMSPEQAQNTRQADIRSDIFSLGCVLYFLLAGKVPYPGESMLDKLTARVTGNAPPLRGQRSEVTPELEQVVQKMMERDLAARFQTPAEVVAALTPFAQPEPEPALPPTVDPLVAPVAPPLPLPARPPSWTLSCGLIALSLGIMVIIGVIAFFIFVWMNKQ
jgi:eukaryotic-like serine/threonine-protein kinase